MNGIDPQIHSGAVPEMRASYSAVQLKLPELRSNSGSRSLFERPIRQNITQPARCHQTLGACCIRLSHSVGVKPVRTANARVKAVEL